MVKESKNKKEKIKSEKKNKGNRGEIFVKGMALLLAVLMVVATASSLIFAIIFA